MTTTFTTEALRKVSHQLYLERNKTLHFNSEILDREVLVEEIPSLHRDDLHTLVNECKATMASLDGQLEGADSENIQAEWGYRARHKRRMVEIFSNGLRNEIEYRHLKLRYETAREHAVAQEAKTARHLKHQDGLRRHVYLRNQALFDLVRDEIGAERFQALVDQANEIATAEWEAEQLQQRAQPTQTRAPK
jgi:hypothetical protein